MNERDKELYEQAEKYADVNFKGEGGGAWAEAFESKFADLIRADEREIWAKDADWCIQNHLEHLIPERIRARSTT